MILFWISKINHIGKLTNGEISKAHNDNRASNGHKAVNACRLGPMIVNVGTQYTLTVSHRWDTNGVISERDLFRCYGGLIRRHQLKSR